MQNLKEEPYNFRPSLPEIRDLISFLIRFRSHPEALDPFLAEFKIKHPDVPETNVSNVRGLMTAMRQTSLDYAASYRVDIYLTAGMGAVDLVLLPIVLPMGVHDWPLFIAAMSLAISLVLVATALFVSFVKRDLRIDSYGKVHGNIIFFSLVFGTTALTATFWHAASIIGIVFLVLILLAYFGCLMYWLFIQSGFRFLAMLNETAPRTPVEVKDAVKEPDDGHISTSEQG